MPLLKPTPCLQDFQTYLQEMVLERGFTKQPTEEVFMRFLEEAGELSKAARNQTKEPNAEHHKDLGYEAADVFIYLLDICNRFNIDLEQAFREKEAVNEKRIWKK